MDPDLRRVLLGKSPGITDWMTAMWHHGDPTDQEFWIASWMNWSFTKRWAWIALQRLLRELREDGVDLWEIYGSDGGLEGTLEIEEGRSSTKPWYPRLAILLASVDEVWGTTRGEYDEPYLHRYRVDRTCAP